jgi:RNA polymerase sigma factor (sigma-70 family)
MSGVELVGKYRNGSEEAFAELVRRYTAFVYSIAKRRLGTAQLAEEAAQSVFMRLARSASRFSNEGELSAWLHRTALHVSVDLWRNESRRKTREQKAAEMTFPMPEEPENWWEAIELDLDEALNKLADTDRQALLLRFFQQRSMRELGAILGVTEDAAKMRVSRAVERLRGLIPSARTVSAAAFATLLESRAVEGAPAPLLAKLTATPLVPASSTSVLLLVTKAKLAIGLVSALALGTAIMSWNKRENTPVVEAFVSTPESLVPVIQQSSVSRAGGSRGDFSARPGAVNSIEEAKRALFGLLQNPPRSGVYPPRELTQVLSAFVGVHEEAMPLLLEAAERQDHETRAWAISGIQYVLQIAPQVPGYEVKAEELFSAARPLLGKILKTSGDPDGLRMNALIAYESYLRWSPTQSHASDVVDDLLSTLRGDDKRSLGFRFTVVDRLALLLSANAVFAPFFAEALTDLLETGNRNQQLLAAFALASDPGERIDEIKAILENEVAERTPHSYRAAAGLGKLGTNALESVPRLLEFAKATEGWGGGGYSRSALKAVCQIDPVFRANHPEIAAELKREEALRQEGPTPRIVSVKANSNAGQPARIEFEPEPVPVEVPFANLVLDARVLLVDKPHPKEKEFERVLEQLNAIGNEPISAVNFGRIKTELRRIDPDFANEWEVQIYKQYPWLDRVAKGR